MRTVARGPSSALVLALLLVAGAAIAPLAQAGQEDKSNGPSDHGRPHHGSEVSGTGVVKAVDDKGRRVNLTHEPILALGWPTMTMDLNVAENVDLKDLKVGARVRFTLEVGPDGIYRILSIENAR